MARPRAIGLSEGYRVKVCLGETGYDYLLVLDEDDGDSEWQTMDWSQTSAGIPNGIPCSIFSVLNNFPERGRYSTEVAFGPEGEWYVSGLRENWSVARAWGPRGTVAADSIKECLELREPLRVVALGDADTWLLIIGDNGFWASANIDHDLHTRLKCIRKQSGFIYYVRLFPNHGYFISDSVGRSWKGVGEQLSKELRASGCGYVLDVAVARDGSWIVIWENGFQSSAGVCKKLDKRLAQFYREQRARREARSAEIAAYSKKQLAAYSAEIAAYRRETRSAEIVRHKAATSDRPEAGQSEAEFSDGFSECDEVAMLVRAEDKYAAAVCTLQYFTPAAVPACLAPASSSSRLFDEYICLEKIDRAQLSRIAKSLRQDSEERGMLISQLRCRRDAPQLAPLKSLQRCADIEGVVFKLEAAFPAAMDKRGRSCRYVLYQHRDVAHRGRLFAVDPQICTSDKCYRTDTLQGMRGDLRKALVGAFGHEVDSENSEYRLARSLAKQYGWEHIVPTVCEYCDKRGVWLNRISQAHRVDEQVAKLLPNIIRSGGLYKTWLRHNDLQHENVQIRDFVRRLQRELHDLRARLLGHPRFTWVSLEREHCEQAISGGAKPIDVDARLMTRILESCENEVLGIVHRCFFDHGWDVIAKIFDAVIVERGSTATGKLIELDSVMVEAERRCRAQGWDVSLAEKPLHGMQDDPVLAITMARRAMPEARRLLRT